MNDFTFTGHWEYELVFPAFAGFQSRQGAYHSQQQEGLKSDGRLSVVFDDDLSDDPDPYPGQLDTLQFVFSHQYEIVEAMLARLREELPGIIRDYGLEEEPQYKDLSDENIKSMIGISEIRIMIPARDGWAYYTLSGGCSWDEEHGLSFLLHNTRVLTCGIIDGNEYWDAVKDNGTYDTLQEKGRENPPPRLYEPHPKYGRLKPSQATANRYYELDLISGFHNEEFKELIRSGKRSVDYRNPDWGFDTSFLSRALQFNNQELVEFLLENKARVQGVIHQAGRDKAKIGIALANGASIDERDPSGHTLLRKELFRMRNELMNRDMAIHAELAANMEKAAGETKDFIQWLVANGADPFIVGMPDILGFWGRDYDHERIKAELLAAVQTEYIPDPPRTHKDPSGVTPSVKPPVKKKWWQFRK